MVGFTAALDVEGIEIFKPSSSSSSVIDGKLWLKSLILRLGIRGDDEAEEAGDGGPKLDTGTREGGDGDVELLAMGEP